MGHSPIIFSVQNVQKWNDSILTRVHLCAAHDITNIHQCMSRLYTEVDSLHPPPCFPVWWWWHQQWLRRRRRRKQWFWREWRWLCWRIQFNCCHGRRGQLGLNIRLPGQLGLNIRLPFGLDIGMLRGWSQAVIMHHPGEGCLKCCFHSFFFSLLYNELFLGNWTAVVKIVRPYKIVLVASLGYFCIACI